MPANLKRTIADEFIALAKKKSIDKITVKELVELCHISRQTFYYHFRDVMDVMDWSVQQAMEGMLTRSLHAQTPEQALTIFILSAQENHALIHRLLTSQRRAEIEQMLVQAIGTYLQEMLRHTAVDIRFNYSDLETATDFCSYGVAGLLLKHCANPHLDTKKLAHQLYELLSGSLLQLG